LLVYEDMLGILMKLVGTLRIVGALIKVGLTIACKSVFNAIV